MAGSLLLTSVQISLQFPSLKFLPGFTTLRWHLDGSKVEQQLPQALIYSGKLCSKILMKLPHGSGLKDVRSLSSRFESPKPMEFQGIFSLSQNSSLCSTIAPLKTYCEHEL